MPPATETRTIRIKIDTSGNREIKDIADRMGLLTRNTKSLASSMGFLRNAFTGWIGALGIREIVNISDTMQRLENRLKVITGSSEEAARAMGLVKDLADSTNQSLTDTASIYTRLAVSMKEANASTEAVVGITKSLINTFRLSGATGAEVTATITQLSQSFASGTLRGDELRSVMEQNAVLAQLLRKRFGQDIFEKAKKGIITTSEVLKVLRDNAEQLQIQAATLTPTIGETLTKAFNNAQAAIGNFSKEFEIPARFAAFVKFVTDNLDILGAAIVTFAVFKIPVLIKSIQAFSIAISSFVLSNPLLIGLTALAAAAVVAYRNMDKIKASTLEYRASLLEGTSASNAKLGLIDDQQFKTQKDRLAEISRLRKEAAGLRGEKDEKSDPTSEAKKQIDEINKVIEAYEKMGLANNKAAGLKNILAELNKEFLTGAINAGMYSDKLLDFNLYKLNREFEEGKINLNAYNEGLAEIQKLNISKSFNEGTLSVKQFNAAMSLNGIDLLNKKLEAGLITIKEYDVELAKVSENFSANSAFRAGTTEFVESIGTTTQQVAQAIKNAFGSLENFFNDFIKTGKFNFKGFVQSILDDLQRIIVRAAIIQPLAQGLLNFSGLGGSTQLPATGGVPGTVVAGKGYAFDKGIKKFAKGGIVSSPTNFGYGKSEVGLMGESGPEAILPLTRGTGGDLGVKAQVTPVNINIVNNSSAEIESKETTGPGGERTIELLIRNKVKEGISSGAFDKSFQTAYGINRKGS